jgi:Uncharacterized protein conserved in bacteria
MLLVISPSKSMDFKHAASITENTNAMFQTEADELMNQLKGYSSKEIMEKEKIGVKLALTAFEYIQTYFSEKPSPKPAIFAYSGTVFNKLQISSISEVHLSFLQDHVLIFSALYGLLKPFDLIKPYRLDMNSNLVTELYPFWRKKVTEKIIPLLEKENNLLINLASAEYFKMIDPKQLPKNTRVITPVFRQEIKGKLSVNSLFAKQARGLMLRFIIENEISDPEYLKAFDLEGYYFDPRLSSTKEYAFTR